MQIITFSGNYNNTTSTSYEKISLPNNCWNVIIYRPLAPLNALQVRYPFKEVCILKGLEDRDNFSHRSKE